MYYDDVLDPKPKDSSTIYRVAKKLEKQLINNSYGVYWPAKRLENWRQEDLIKVRDLAGCEGMMRGEELVWHNLP